VPLTLLTAAGLSLALVGVLWVAEPWRFQEASGRIALVLWSILATCAVVGAGWALMIVFRGDRPGIGAEILTQPWPWLASVALAIPVTAAGLFGPGLGWALSDDPSFGFGKAMFVGVSSLGLLLAGLVVVEPTQVVWLEGGQLRIRTPWAPRAEAVSTADIRTIALTSATWRFRRWYGARFVMADGREIGLVGGLDQAWVDATASRIAERTGARVEPRR
jgi:hypothetical protein